MSDNKKNELEQILNKILSERAKKYGEIKDILEDIAVAHQRATEALDEQDVRIAAIHRANQEANAEGREAAEWYEQEAAQQRDIVLALRDKLDAQLDTKDAIDDQIAALKRKQETLGGITEEEEEALQALEDQQKELDDIIDKTKGRLDAEEDVLDALDKQEDALKRSKKAAEDLVGDFVSLAGWSSDCLLYTSPSPRDQA